MTTIDNIQDFIRVLGENPDWLEEVRIRVLTRELLGLPQVVAELAASHARLENTFQRFVETTDRRLEALENTVAELAASHARLENTFQRFVETTDRRLDALETTVAELAASHARLENTLQQFVETTDRRLDALETTVAELAASHVRLETTVAELAASHVRLETTVAELAASHVRLEGTVAKLASIVEAIHKDVGKIRGVYARDAIIADADGAAWELGFELQTALSRKDILGIIRSSDTSGIDRGDLQSFRTADLIMEVTDSEGADCYIAMEISYTVHWDDTRRAIRNAEFLTRFTGIPAHAVVAGVNLNDRIRRGVIESKEALWYEIPDKLAQAD